MRRLLIALVVLSLATTSARAGGFGIGFFLGDPTGLDLKIDLDRRSSLDILLGIYTFRDRGPSYGHLTYLVTLGTAYGQSVNVPFRLGLGGAVYGNSDDVALGARAPFEVALAFKRTPIEIYGELAALLTIVGSNDRLDIQGGLGLRFRL